MLNRKQRRQYAKNINTPQKLEQYSREFDLRIRKEYQQEFEKKYKQTLEESIDNFLVAIVYTLHFNEKTSFENEDINDFMEDLLATVNLFTTGEATPEFYIQELKKDNIEIMKSNKKEGD